MRAYRSVPNQLSRAMKRSGLSEIAEKVFHGERLSVEDGALLFDATCPCGGGVGELRNGPWRPYVFNRNLHINDEMCEADCIEFFSLKDR